MTELSNDVSSLTTQAEAEFESKHFAQAETLYKHIITLQTRNYNADDTSIVMREMYNLSSVLLKQGKCVEAEGQLTELLPLLEARARPDDEETRDIFRQQEQGARELLQSARSEEQKKD